MEDRDTSLGGNGLAGFLRTRRARLTRAGPAFRTTAGCAGYRACVAKRSPSSPTSASTTAVAVLRMEAGRHPTAPDLFARVGELSIRDQDFRAWWTSHPVHRLGQLTRTFHHPLAGTLNLDIHQLSISADLLLVAYTAPSGSHSRETPLVLLQASACRTDDDAAPRGEPRPDR